MLAEVYGAQLDRAGRVIVELRPVAPGASRGRRDWGHGVGARPPQRPAAARAGAGGDPGRPLRGARLAARLHDEPSHPPFHYLDKGTLATIGRAAAVADVRGLRFGGFAAWATWLVVHIFYLIGFENRAVVIFRWAYSYLTRGRGSRLITTAAHERST